MPPGRSQAILKVEQARSDEAYDIHGDRHPAAEREETMLSLYVERGLTQRVTLQGKAAWIDGEDDGRGYGGRGPLELGLRYLAYQDARTAVSVYVGVIDAGRGRNAGYADPGVGGTDVEARVLAGRSFRVLQRPAFAEAQVARLARADLSAETRLDLTLGVEPTPDWLLMVQSYAGEADVGSRWVKLETSAVRRFGAWRIQAGWRFSLAGRAGPAEQGPALGLWRAF
ncbi:hypothetical protein CSW64_08930 [Caulobacter mirabilis]|uniref:Alginate export domain-containing protein n=2 Tax=Caulobacter mirabilis TaxID=69666 RepID=A0A2D2B3Y9_9CAUL|nr:hypothetical protein CSW64_08930 [Caulobacter mirabilis]